MGNEVTIDIEPIPQPRHRVTSIGGRARTYLPVKHPVHAYKQRIAEAVKDWPKYAKGVPVQLWIAIRFAMPASWSKKTQARMWREAHTQKPDLDNLAKAIMDAMSGCWHDDCQVHRVTVEKRWDDTSSVFIRLEALTDEQ
jgi:Holliday junction resolvase RusA-like endonuclease